MIFDEAEAAGARGYSIPPILLRIWCYALLGTYRPAYCPMHCPGPIFLGTVLGITRTLSSYVWSYAPLGPYCPPYILLCIVRTPSPTFVFLPRPFLLPKLNLSVVFPQPNSPRTHQTRPGPLPLDPFGLYRWEYEISVSFLEIYNEALRDLLSDGQSNRKLEIKHVDQGRTAQVWSHLQKGQGFRS
eukprot:3362117-Rhodomonas_salina.2